MSLIDQALLAQSRAYAPYSKFKVGCAVLGEKGTIYVGCNVENSSYPAGICAERVAISQAIAQGEKSIKEFTLIASSDKPCMPCGVCLQVISELGSPDLVVTSYSQDKSKVQKLKLKELLPHAFDKSFLTR